MASSNLELIKRNFDVTDLNASLSGHQTKDHEGWWQQKKQRQVKWVRPDDAK